jgi:hypothetical protein
MKLQSSLIRKTTMAERKGTNGISNPLGPSSWVLLENPFHNYLWEVETFYQGNYFDTLEIQLTLIRNIFFVNIKNGVVKIIF